MTQTRIAQREMTLRMLKKFGIRLSKKLGQNFLTDTKILDGIIAAANLSPADAVLEIGPGIGALTERLAETGAKVTAVELDAKLVEVLRQTFAAHENVRILHGDILKIDITETMAAEKYKVVANLPYYITTPIMMKFLEERLPVELLVTMVQKEVAERIVAQPGGKDYGALTVAMQYYTSPEIMFTVPPGAFIPAPEVDSAVIRCIVRSSPPVSVLNERTFFKVVRAAFGQRRKTLSNALKATGLDKDSLQNIFDQSQIDGQRRGEQLSLAEFARIADGWESFCGKKTF